MHARNSALCFIPILAGGMLVGGADGQCTGRWRYSQQQDRCAIDGDVISMVEWDADGDGPRRPELVCGGNFLVVGRPGTTHIASWTGQSWSAELSPLNSYVPALYVFNGDLIAGGGFSGDPGLHNSRWDRSVGAWTPIGLGMDGDVLALSEFDGQLVAGGAFNFADGQRVSRIARWDGTSWRDMAAGMNNQVFALANYQGHLIAGGGFTEAGGVPVGFIALWDGAAWHPLASGMNGAVRALTTTNLQGSELRLVAGGSFGSAGGVSVNSVAAWNGSVWQPLGNGLGVGVNALTVVNGVLHAGGTFTSPARRVAAWNGGAWVAVGNRWINDTLPVYVLAEFGDELCVGGGGDSVARLGSDARWHRLESGLHNYQTLSVTAYAAEVIDDELVIGGDFLTIGGTSVNQIAAWDGAEWRSFGNGIPPAVNTSIVRCLDTWNGNLYAGGYFGGWTNFVLRFANGAWSSFGPQPNGQIYSLATYNDLLFIGGNYSHIGSELMHGVAAWDGSSWYDLVGPVTTITDVYALHVYRNELVAAGRFGSIGGGPAASLAAWDGETWRPLGAGLTGPTFSFAHCLASYGDDLVVGGTFTVAGGAPANRVARWDGENWFPMGTAQNNGVNSTVYAVEEYRGLLIAAGDFNLAGGLPASRIAAWDGNTWQALGEGVNSRATGLTQYGGELIVVGLFGTAGGHPSYRWARWAPDNGDVNGDRRVDLADLSTLLTSFGTAHGALLHDGDVDGDGNVSLADLAILLANYGAECL